MRTARIVLAAFGAAVVIKSFLFDVMIAEGRSMLPAIRPGSALIVNRVAYGLRNPFSNGYLIHWLDPRPGDVVVFPSRDGKLAVKRFRESAEAGRFLALGDNAEESYDSRQYGPVSADSIIGKVVGVK